MMGADLFVTTEGSPMIRSEPKNHKGTLPSPIAGMSMSHWLGSARAVEYELERFLLRDDLTLLQREKIGELLLVVRSCLAKQLDRLNAPPAQGSPDP